MDIFSYNMRVNDVLYLSRNIIGNGIRMTITDSLQQDTIIIYYNVDSDNHYSPIESIIENGTMDIVNQYTG